MGEAARLVEAEEAVPSGHIEQLVAQLTQSVAELRSAVSHLRVSARVAALGEEALCPIYFDDEIYPVALPFADHESTQSRLAEARQPLDPVLLRQLLDFVPSLTGRSLIDVGSFTGLTAVMLGRLLDPAHIYMFEPQKVMRPALERTIAANGLADCCTLSSDVIGEEGEACLIGATRPDRLAETGYLRRSKGKLKCRSIDSLQLDQVGLINLDYCDSKIPAMRGMSETIARCRPVIVVDLSGRDIGEVDHFMQERNYVMQRAGRYSAIYLPG